MSDTDSRTRAKAVPAQHSGLRTWQWEWLHARALKSLLASRPPPQLDEVRQTCFGGLRTDPKACQAHQSMPIPPCAGDIPKAMLKAG